MSLQITGKVIAICKPETGSGSKGEWKKQTFAIETQDQYPKKVAFEAFNKIVDVSDKLKDGQEITVHFNPESREYQGKWYSGLKAWKIDVKGNPQVVNNASNSGNDNLEEDLPF